MVKAVANSPHIYNRNVSYATNTAIVFSYERFFPLIGVSFGIENNKKKGIY